MGSFHSVTVQWLTTTTVAWRPSVSSPHGHQGTVTTVTDGPACWKQSLSAEIYQHEHINTRAVDRQHNLLSNGLRLAAAALPGWCRSAEGNCTTCSPEFSPEGTVLLASLNQVQQNSINPNHRSCDSSFLPNSSPQCTKLCRSLQMYSRIYSATHNFQCLQKSPPTSGILTVGLSHRKISHGKSLAFSSGSETR